MTLVYQGFGLDSLVSCCPGPGNSWGNLAAPPASKEAVSPSINILYCTVLGCGLWLGYTLKKDYHVEI